MTALRIIKKYPNRRLYDTAESRYITLADIRHLVLEQVDFQVVDTKTGTDITRAILLQVINEQEARGEPIMSKECLTTVILAHDVLEPGFLAGYLEDTLNDVMQRKQYRRATNARAAGIDSASAVADMSQTDATASRPPSGGPAAARRPGTAPPRGAKRGAGERAADLAKPASG